MFKPSHINRKNHPFQATHDAPEYGEGLNTSEEVRGELVHQQGKNKSVLFTIVFILQVHSEVLCKTGILQVSLYGKVPATNTLNTSWYCNILDIRDFQQIVLSN